MFGAIGVAGLGVLLFLRSMLISTMCDAPNNTGPKSALIFPTSGLTGNSGLSEDRCAWANSVLIEVDPNNWTGQ